VGDVCISWVQSCKMSIAVKECEKCLYRIVATKG
jgi:hypothetical protein